MPVAAGIFTLLGVLVSQTITVRLARSQADREKAIRTEQAARRWDQDVRQVYSRFGVAVRILFRHDLRSLHLSRSSPGKGDKPLGYEDALSEELLAFQEVEFMGSPEVVNEARELHRLTVLRREWRYSLTDTGSFSEADELGRLNDLLNAQSRFTNAARAQLGLPPLDMRDRPTLVP